MFCIINNYNLFLAFSEGGNIVNSSVEAKHVMQCNATCEESSHIPIAVSTSVRIYHLTLYFNFIRGTMCTGLKAAFCTFC